MERSLSLQGRRGRFGFAALVFSAVVVGLLSIVLTAGTVVRVARGESTTVDLSSFYTAGWLVREGREGQVYDLDVQQATQRELSGGDYDRPLPFASPAFVAYLFAPFTVLPLRAAYGVMWVANLALLAGSLLMLREVLRPLAPRPRRTLLASTVVGIPTLAVLSAGQIDLLIVDALLGGYLLVQRNRPFAAGFVLAAVLMKPQLALGVLLLLLVTGQWRVLAPLVGAGAVLAVTPVLGMGFEAIRGNVEALGSVGVVAMMANWRGLLVSLGLPDRVLVWGPGWALIACGASFVAVRCWRRADTSPAQSWAVAIALPLVVSPHLHGQSLVLVFPAAALALTAFIRAEAIDEEQAVLASLVLYVALFARWAITLTGVSPGVFLIVPLFAVTTLAPRSLRAHSAVSPAGRAGRRAA